MWYGFLVGIRRTVGCADAYINEHPGGTRAHTTHTSPGLRTRARAPPRAARTAPPPRRPPPPPPRRRRRRAAAGAPPSSSPLACLRSPTCSARTGTWTGTPSTPPGSRFDGDRRNLAGTLVPGNLRRTVRAKPCRNCTVFIVLPPGRWTDLSTSPCIRWNGEAGDVVKLYVCNLLGGVTLVALDRLTDREDWTDRDQASSTPPPCFRYWFATVCKSRYACLHIQVSLHASPRQILARVYSLLRREIFCFPCRESQQWYQSLVYA